MQNETIQDVATLPSLEIQSTGPWTRFWEFAGDVWNYQITINETTIAVSQIAIALLVFFVGLIVIKIIARRVGGTVLPRLKVEPGPASAIQTILYYFLLTMVVIFALQIGGVPLTIFTIFGGALALGIGFGSQNIVNNFISGLILLVERPIQVHDLITVDGESGTVVKVGARATKFLSYTGTTIIVPNSKMLESAVVNWNQPTTEIRSTIGVGVAYGSDTAQVKELLETIFDKHDRVLDSTENRVLFMDFGSSSLDFEIHFWISPHSVLDRNQIESDLRFKIDQSFREHNISIPFPQRDLNFKPSAAVEVQMATAP